MLNYEIILYWSEEDGVFVAEVAERLARQPTGMADR